MSQQDDELLVITSWQLGSLVFLLYEIVITFDDEVNLIWSYFALAAQLANRSIESAIRSNLYLDTELLRDWFSCQVVVATILMIAVELVLMARVYALYKKSMCIGGVLLVLLLGEVLTVLIGIAMTAPGKDFEAKNLLVNSPSAYTSFGIAAAITQFTILVLTLVKYRTAVKGGWGNAPIMFVMVRDGIVAFVILLVVTMMTIIVTMLPNEYAPVGNSWFLSIVACAGSRLIINMQNLPTQSCSESSTCLSIQFTTLSPDSDAHFT
ncbi:uncharacterized protein LACBIDRAFT_293173 [Laccaria bicolor S238N-H82]|uniref:Predicted protein n=1 Tax=Laccaria bicolor (strain S238N-H82 / ATCC MYA-4686) TaxID=486041 RepID=B0D173_LACBS|nr:uncharacterized protein LACBIDRAFT_293173 [Laccaria bicolor S238N-H82]EDR11583.1 predicted protein [Laccaria bicolor S238N-H82]|eukprot:XP_001877480.1 predicted protein [Laccaria bicolor S238N-H82]